MTKGFQQTGKQFFSSTDLLKPLIHVKKPHLRDRLNEIDVTTTCVVEAPYNTEVSWLVNGARRKATKEAKADLSSITQNIVSNLTLPTMEWLKIKTLVCKAEHACVQAEKAAVKAGKLYYTK